MIIKLITLIVFSIDKLLCLCATLCGGQVDSLWIPRELICQAWRRRTAGWWGEHWCWWGSRAWWERSCWEARTPETRGSASDPSPRRGCWMSSRSWCCCCWGWGSVCSWRDPRTCWTCRRMSFFWKWILLFEEKDFLILITSVPLLT